MISVIITALNEDKNILNQTVDSIWSTSNGKAEIIVIDDCSEIPVEINNKNVILRRNIFRMGVGMSRHIGATLATNKWFLFTDSHMIFDDNWYKNVIPFLEKAKFDTAFCGVCLGLNDEFRTLENHRGCYYGARISLYDEEKKNILEGKWIKEVKGEDNYEISCMMGAVYFISKEMYFRIRGFSDLRMWGSSEPCLSLKIWLAGGEIRLLKTVKVGHIFRKTAPYSTYVKYLIYNKIRLSKTLLPEEIGRLLISKLPQNKEFFEACDLIRKEDRAIKEYKTFYNYLFTRDIFWFSKKFDIWIPR